MAFIQGHVSIFIAFYDVASFKLTQEIDNMASSVKGIVPGGTGQFHINPLTSAGTPGSFPQGVIPTWTLSDTSLATVTPAADGMTASIAMADSATPGASLTVRVSASLPDGSTPTTGAVALPVLTLEIVAIDLIQDS